MIPGNLDMTDGEPEPINSNPTPKWKKKMMIKKNKRTQTF
jgi:hypothetical protein